MYTITDFHIGDRVQLSPATDAWFSGDRYGTVVLIGHKLVHVLMDRSNKTRRMRPENIGEILP